MAAESSSITHPRRPARTPGDNLSLAIRVVILAIVDFLVLSSIQQFFESGTRFVGWAIVLTLVGLNAIILFDRFVPLRWLAPGLVMLVLFTIAPMAYTFYVAFSNYNGNHLLTREQAVQAIEQQTYLAPDAPTYKWAAYQNPAGEFALWLVGADGTTTRFAPQSGEIQDLAPGGEGVGAPDANGFPTQIDDYRLLTRPESVRNLQTLSQTTFGEGSDTVQVATLSQAAQYQQRYEYDASANTMTDLQTGTTYTPREGTFTAADGTAITPAFQTTIGWGNFTRLFTNQAIREPVTQILVWTFVYAISVVVIQFILGLIISLALNDKVVPKPLAKTVRSFMLLPYIVPGFLMILVWAAMFNPLVGIASDGFGILGIARDWWTTDAYGAKVMVILVTVWLGFPYFVLIVSGALQAVSEEVLEAAEVDGANYWQRLRSILLPILLQMTAPLIVLGFAANFNNFVLIFLLTGGGPPIPGATVPAGSTDILLSFTYKAAFTFGNTDYGLATVITMFIFIILLPIVATQFRRLPAWQED